MGNTLPIVVNLLLFWGGTEFVTFLLKQFFDRRFTVF